MVAACGGEGRGGRALRPRQAGAATRGGRAPCPPPPGGWGEEPVKAVRDVTEGGGGDLVEGGAHNIRAALRIPQRLLGIRGLGVLLLLRLVQVQAQPRLCRVGMVAFAGGEAATASLALRPALVVEGVVRTQAITAPRLFSDGRRRLAPRAPARASWEPK